MKWFWACFMFASLCYLLPAQTPNLSIEIAGVQVRPGMTVSQAMLLFKGKHVTRNDTQLWIAEPYKPPPGGLRRDGTIETHHLDGSVTYEPPGDKIVGTLHIGCLGCMEEDMVLGACRPRDYSLNAEDSDSELARVLFAFAAVNGSGSKEPTQNAWVTTSVWRQPQWTDEILEIQIGQRVISVTRRENYLADPNLPHILSSVMVEECLWKPGYGPLIPVEATGKAPH
jgi:hypothetical protein